MSHKTLSSRQIWERSILEEDVFGACRNLLELNGAVVHRIVERIPWGRKKSEAGIPDSFGWWPRGCWVQYSNARIQLDTPLHFYIEMKRPFKANYRESQIRWIERAKSDGVIAFFADSVDALAKGFLEYGIKLRGVDIRN